MCSGQSISACTMTPVQSYSKATGQFAQTIRFHSRDDIARRANCAQMRTAIIEAKRFEFCPDNAIVEAYIVGHKYAIFREFNNRLGDFVEFWCRANHQITNSGEVDNERWDAYFWIDERNVLVDDFLPIMLIDGYFCD